MKKLIILIIFTMNVFANITELDIEGIWEIPEEIDGNVSIAEIFVKENKAYVYAFLYATKVNNELIERDISKEKSDAATLKNTIFLSDLTFNGESFVDGKMYRPSNGNVYYVSANLSEDKQTLNVRVSIDSFGLFGETLTWKRLPSNKYKPPSRDNITIVDALTKNNH